MQYVEFCLSVDWTQVDSESETFFGSFRDNEWSTSSLWGIVPVDITCLFQLVDLLLHELQLLRRVRALAYLDRAFGSLKLDNRWWD